MSNNSTARATVLWGTVPIFIFFVVTSWATKPYSSTASVVVLHADGCQIVRSAGKGD
jgi:hypothetical protein